MVAQWMNGFREQANLFQMAGAGQGPAGSHHRMNGEAAAGWHLAMLGA